MGDLVGRPLCAGCRVRSEPLCASCRDDVARALDRSPPPAISRLLIAWRYDGPVRALVLDLKLRGWRAAADPLIGAMARRVHANGLAGSAITWVPARAADIRRRGYDHAAVLAEGLASELGLPAVRLLQRVGAAFDQAGLGAEERRRNLEKVFEARRTPKSVVLVDDVITTGATLAACGRALKRGGARSVETVVATCA